MPRANPEADSRTRPEGTQARSEVSSPTSSIIHDPAELSQKARRHAFGLLVISERSDGVLMSQVYTSMHPAERRVARTRERGLSASITLVRLVPVSDAHVRDFTLVDGGLS